MMEFMIIGLDFYFDFLVDFIMDIIVGGICYKVSDFFFVFVFFCKNIYFFL